MNAAQEKKTLTVKNVPASPAQIVKVMKLIVDQKPTVSSLQKAMRFLPSLLQASDINLTNRFDFCRLIDSPVPFEVYESKSGESGVNTSVDYLKPISDFYLELASKGVKIPDRNELRHFNDYRCEPGSTREWILVGPEKEGWYSNYDLGIANLRELLTLAMFDEVPFKVPFRDYTIDCYNAQVFVENRKVKALCLPRSCRAWERKELELDLVRRVTPDEINNMSFMDRKARNLEQDSD